MSRRGSPICIATVPLKIADPANRPVQTTVTIRGRCTFANTWGTLPTSPRRQGLGGDKSPTATEDSDQNAVVVILRFPDPDYAETFRAYSNYVVDLASVIGGHFGWGASIAEGVVDGVSLHLTGSGIQRRSLAPPQLRLLELAPRKSWGDLRRLRREVDDIDGFDEESNAWLPVQAYYAVYNSVVAYSIASGQIAKNHRAALAIASRSVTRGLLPYPWSMHCEGCPQTKSHSIKGGQTSSAVHVLSSPGPSTSPDRLAMFLRTTREKELERRFADERNRNVAPQRSRRNISAQRKESFARSVPATTVFDLFWRLRRKANYDDADTFVLGAAGVADAQAFANSLALLADSSVAAMEALVIAYVGPKEYARMVTAYRDRVRARAGSPVAIRAAIFRDTYASIDEAPF